jgi:uncharacterized protein YjbJ (UPF0337 family)
MNKNQLTGAIKVTMGIVQQQVGEALGNKKQQAKGIRKQLEGKVQQTFGNAQETFKGVSRYR